jgi:predicted CopG family antitoxin
MTKVISLSESAYAKMKAMKQGGESFSDVVHRMAENTGKKSLVEFFGRWPGPVKEVESIKRTLEKDRRRFKTREASF